MLTSRRRKLGTLPAQLPQDRGFAGGAVQVAERCDERRTPDRGGGTRRNGRLRIALDPGAVGPRTIQRGELAFPGRARGQGMDVAVHLADQGSVENLVLGIAVDQHFHLRRRKANEGSLLRLFDRHCFAQALDHPVRCAIRPASRGEDQLAVQLDVTVVVSDDFQPPRRIAFEPSRQLPSVCVFKGVIAVQERDPPNVVGDSVRLVQVSEDETPAAAVARQADGRFAGQRLLDAVDDRTKALLGMLLAPGRPGMKIVFQIRDDDVAIRKGLGSKRVCAPMCWMS